MNWGEGLFGLGHVECGDGGVGIQWYESVDRNERVVMALVEEHTEGGKVE